MVMYGAMLKLFRKNTKVIIWSVVVCFGLWGAYSMSSSLGREDRYAGEIHGRGVTYQEFNKFQKATQFLTYTGKANEDPDALRQRTWQNILYSREAKRLGLEVADDEVRLQVLGILQTQGIQNPNPQIYRQWLQATLKETPREFEEKVREFIRIQKLLRLILKTPTPADPEWMRKHFHLDTDTLSFDAVKFPDLESAQDFRQKTNEGKKWDSILKKEKLKAEEQAPENLTAIMEKWLISQEDVLALFALDKNTASAPLRTQGQFTVCRVLDKKAATDGQYPEWEKTFLEKRSQHQFINWSMELFRKANFKDFLPRSSSEEDASNP